MECLGQKLIRISLNQAPQIAFKRALKILKGAWHILLKRNDMLL
jgi:hypothetical protein